MYFNVVICVLKTPLSIIVNSHVPAFVESTATISLAKRSRSSSVVYHAKARDVDSEHCPEKSELCACADLLYFIVDDESGSTRIDEKTGEVSVDLDLLDEDRFGMSASTS